MTDADIVTHLEEEGEREIKNDSDASVAENDRTAVPVADSGLSSQSNVPMPEVVALVEEEEEESVQNALTPAAATQEPPPPAVILPDVASPAVVAIVVEPSTRQSEESPTSVPLGAAAAPPPTPSDAHEARVSPTDLVEQGTFGISTATTTASASSAAAALPGTAFLPAENTNDGETKSEEHCDTGVANQQQQQQPTIFVNHGLAAWEESRRQWLNHQDEQADVVVASNNNNVLRNNPNLEHAVSLNVDEIIDVVFASPRQLRANGGKGQNFPQPVTLPQMVDILQDLWEAEGLDV